MILEPPLIEDNLKNEDDLKNEGNLKNEDDLKNEEIVHTRTNRKDDIFKQRRLYNDKAHTVLDIFR